MAHLPLPSTWAGVLTTRPAQGRSHTDARGHQRRAVSSLALGRGRGHPERGGATARYARDMLEICPRYTRDIIEMCEGYARSMLEIFPRYARDLLEIRPRYVRDLSHLRVEVRQYRRRLEADESNLRD